MRVVMPLAGEDYPAAQDAAVKYAPNLYRIKLVGDEAYYELLKREWREPGDTYLIEHDIVIREDTIADLAECPGAWCGAVYLVMGVAFSAAFGCTKFDARLKRAYPNVWADMLTEFPNMPPAFQQGGPKHWRTLDSRFLWLMQKFYGFGVICAHYPALVHLNETMLNGRDPYELAKASPNPKPHECWKHHFCRCLIGTTGHPCPMRSNLDGSGVICHTAPNLADTEQVLPAGLDERRMGWSA